MIPAEAVEAAAKAWNERKLQPGNWTSEDSARAALEAAAPYMRGAANGVAPRKGPLVVPVPRSAVTNLYRTSKTPTKPDQPGGVASE
jgi:hypothetical protein